MMNEQKRKDLYLGLSMEKILQPVLENKFGKLNATKLYDVFDYENEKFCIELKTRRVSFGDYPSLMFGYNKIKKAEKIKDKDVYFFFKLKDGLYYWKYNDTQYEKKLGGRNDRGFNEYKDCVYIKNEFIENWNDLEIKI